MIDVATLAGDGLLALATVGVSYVGRRSHKNQKQLQENSRKLEVLTDAELNARIRQEVAFQLRQEAGRSLRRSLDAVLGTHDISIDEQEG